jgi:predicted RNA-binding protein YlqC (UPF0109 family)
MNPPKYRYADEVNDGNVPIQILDGQCEGLMLRYFKVILEEKDGGLFFDYDYEIVKNPDNIEVTKDVKDIFTSILISVMNEQIVDMPDDLDLLKESSDSEEHRNSNTAKSHIQ